MGTLPSGIVLRRPHSFWETGAGEDEQNPFAANRNDRARPSGRLQLGAILHKG
jgi:hypothetical protein